MEDNPHIKIKIDSYPHEMTRQNSGLYTFLGGLSMYDHVYTYSEQADRVGYLFHDMDKYTEYKRFFIRNKFPLHMNLTKVQDLDVRAYHVHHAASEVTKRLVQEIKIIPSALRGLIVHEPQTQ